LSVIYHEVHTKATPETKEEPETPTTKKKPVTPTSKKKAKAKSAVVPPPPARGKPLPKVTLFS
jgi:hypothetical protein